MPFNANMMTVGQVDAPESGSMDYKADTDQYLHYAGLVCCVIIYNNVYCLRLLLKGCIYFAPTMRADFVESWQLVC